MYILNFLIIKKINCKNLTVKNLAIPVLLFFANLQMRKIKTEIMLFNYLYDMMKSGKIGRQQVSIKMFTFFY